MYSIGAEFRDGIVEVGTIEKIKELRSQNQRVPLGKKMRTLLYCKILTDISGAGVWISMAGADAGLPHGSAIERGRGI